MVLRNSASAAHIEKFNAAFKIHRLAACRTTIKDGAQSLSLVFRIPFWPACGKWFGGEIALRWHAGDGARVPHGDFQQMKSKAKSAKVGKKLAAGKKMEPTAPLRMAK